MQRQHADLVVLALCHLAAARKIDEVVGAVPSLYGVEALVNLTAQRRGSPSLGVPLKQRGAPSGDPCARSVAAAA
jgi:hypothetical protein